MNNNVVDSQSYAKSVPSPMKLFLRNWQSVNHIPGIHDLRILLFFYQGIVWLSDFQQRITVILTVLWKQIGAFPHTKKARFGTRSDSNRDYMFARVHTGQKKARILNRDYFLRVSPHMLQKNRDPNRTGFSENSCACVLFVRLDNARRQRSARLAWWDIKNSGTKLSFTVLTHFAQKIVAIISNNRPLLGFKKTATISGATDRDQNRTNNRDFSLSPTHKNKQ